MINPLFAPPNESNAYVRGSLEALDDPINGGIGFLHKHWVLHGGAADRGKIQMKDWIAVQQRNETSIYWCYGLDQEKPQAATATTGIKAALERLR